MRYSTSYPADEHYHSAALENGVQLTNQAGAVVKGRCLVGLYVTNAAAATVYLLVSDDHAGPHGLAVNRGTVYPIAAEPGDLAVSLHGGEEFAKGIYLGAYTTKALAIAGGAPDAGAVLLIKADFTAGKYIPIA